MVNFLEQKFIIFPGWGKINSTWRTLIIEITDNSISTLTFFFIPSNRLTSNVHFSFVFLGLFTGLLTTEIIRLQTMYLSNPTAKTRLRILRDPAGPLFHIAYIPGPWILLSCEPSSKLFPDLFHRLFFYCFSFSFLQPMWLNVCWWYRDIFI